MSDNFTSITGATNLTLTTTVNSSGTATGSNSGYIQFIEATNLPANSGITLTNFGNSSATGYISTNSTLYFNGGDIVFSSGTGDNKNGVYHGGDSGVAAAPEPNGTTPVTTDYLAAEPGGSITYNFTSSQVYFGILWGSVDAYNTLTFYNSSGTQVGEITGQELENAGAIANGSDSYYVSVNITGGYDKVVMTSSSPAFEFLNIGYSSTAVTTPDTGTGATQVSITSNSNGTGVICFLAGTMITTPAGEVAVETLKAGDMVTTADGGTTAVTWLGRQTVSTRFANPLRVTPIRIKADALADGVPTRDLLVSPDHAVLVDGTLAHASALVNGVSIVRESRVPQSFVYYHVETANHELILAEGAAAETFIDNAERLAFDNWNEHPGNAALVEMDLPRAKSARQLPAAARARLAARAQTAVTAAA